MGEFLDQIPEKLQEQIAIITKSSGLEDTEASKEMMAQAWIEKNKVFDETMKNMSMEECELMDKNDERGAIILTYSGSIITVGPLVDGVRKVEYTSIGLRKDVPDSATDANSLLAGNIVVDEVIQFEQGPVKSSSPAFKIAQTVEVLQPEEEESKLAQATMVLADEFTEINKTIIV